MVAILFSILIFDYVVLLSPQARLFKEIRNKVSQKSKDLKKAKTDIALIGQFQERSEVLQKKMEQLAFRIPQEEEIPLIVENISRIANESFVKITSIKPLKEEKQLFLSSEMGTYYEIPIAIEAKCGYHQLGKFINKLENNQTVMNVAGLEVAPNPQDKFRRFAKLLIKTFILSR